jgi:hypothetical protein
VAGLLDKSSLRVSILYLTGIIIRLASVGLIRMLMKLTIIQLILIIPIITTIIIIITTTIIIIIILTFRTYPSFKINLS